MSIHYQYHHKDHDYWSAIFDLAPRRATELARAHYAEDIIGIKVREGARLYELPSSDIERMHRVCSRTWLDHIITAGDCWLTYYGQGRFEFSTNPTLGIVRVDAAGNVINSV